VKWATAKESTKNAVDSGVVPGCVANQIEMAQIIPDYRFGMSTYKVVAGPSLEAATSTKCRGSGMRETWMNLLGNLTPV
jgi:hypothetical protein